MSNKWNSKAQTSTILGCRWVAGECLVAIGAKSFRDGGKDICKDTESNLGPLRLKLSRSKLYFSFRVEQIAKNNYELALIMQAALFFCFFSFLTHLGHFFLPNSCKESLEKMFPFKV